MRHLFVMKSGELLVLVQEIKYEPLEICKYRSRHQASAGGLMEEFSQQTMFSGRLEMASHLTQTMLGNMVSPAVEAIRTPRSIIHLLLLTVHPKPVEVRTLFHVVGILKVSPAGS